MVRPVVRAAFLKPAALVVAALLYFGIIPPALASRRLITRAQAVVFYLAGSAAVIYAFRRYHARSYSFESRAQEFQEELNMVASENASLLGTRSALQSAVEQYRGLQTIIERLNASLETDHVASFLAETAFESAGRREGACQLYAVDDDPSRLRLLKSVKAQGEPPVKAKEGDIFDLWVVRHQSPLFIADSYNDFRFDAALIAAEGVRPIGSLISCPLLSAGRFLGVLRLDNPRPRAYSQDDLRFLAQLSDLGAAALENSLLYSRTEKLAVHDELTGLYTKTHFHALLAAALRRARARQSGLALVMLDIDHFKHYNDTYGHTMGDYVLKRIGAVLPDFFSGFNPVIGRFGGEEFCVALPDTTVLKAYELACNLCVRIAQDPLPLRRELTRVTVSAGVAAFPSDANDEEGLIAKADQALYRAKRSGRNCVCCF